MRSAKRKRAVPKRSSATVAPQRFLEGANAIGPPVFSPGMRVVRDFGKLAGYTRKQSRAVGTIIATKGRFLATPGFAEWVHEVRLDDPICGCLLWEIKDKKLERLEPE